MPDVRYRPSIRRLLDEILAGVPSEVITVDISNIAERTGVSRQTIYTWMRADTDNPNDWFTRYNPETEYQFRRFFTEVLGRDVEVIERIVLNDSPNFQETAIARSAM